MTCMIGSALMLLCIGLLGEIRAAGGWINLEHPADPERRPFPSVFCTAELAALVSFGKLSVETLHQCMFGAPSVKPTMMAMSRLSFGAFEGVCAITYAST